MFILECLYKILFEKMLKLAIDSTWFQFIKYKYNRGNFGNKTGMLFVWNKTYFYVRSRKRYSWEN